MSSPTFRRMCPCALRPSWPILDVQRLWWGVGYLRLDELGMHKLRGDSNRGGSPRSGHEPHLISTMYNCRSRAGSQWGRRTGGGQRNILGDVGGQVPSLLMDGDPNVSLWANVWDGPASSCVMEPTS